MFFVELLCLRKEVKESMSEERIIREGNSLHSGIRDDVTIIVLEG